MDRSTRAAHPELVDEQGSGYDGLVFIGAVYVSLFLAAVLLIVIARAAAASS